MRSAFPIPHFSPRQLFNVTAVLLAIELCDEIISGFPAVGLPLTHGQLGLSYAQIGWILSGAELAAMLIEPGINLISDRGPRRVWMLGSLVCLVVALLLASNGRSFTLLLVAFIIMYPAIGTILGLAQTTIIELSPENPTHAMTRWTIMGSVGDLVAPLAVTGILALGWGWSGLCWIGAALWALIALALWRQRLPPLQSLDEDDPDAGMLAGLRAALGNRALLRWSAITMICTMVDEIFLTFATIYLHDGLHANAAQIGIVLATGMAAGMLALVGLARLARQGDTRQILPWLAVVTLAAIVGFLLAPSLWIAAIAFAVISAGAASWYPIAQAAAYATLPGRTGIVRAVMGLGMPFEAALPGVVGLVTAHFGAWAGVATLGTAPLLVLALLPWRTESQPGAGKHQFDSLLR